MSQAVSKPPCKRPIATGSVELLLGPDHKKNLVVELASELEPARDTLKRYGMTKKDLAQLLTDEPALQKHYKDAQVMWDSPMNVRERVNMKAAMCSEAGLLRLHQLIHSADTPPSNVIAAHQHMSTLGNLMPSKAGESGDTGSRFSIVLNIGKSQDREPIKVVGEVIEQEVEDGE